MRAAIGIITCQRPHSLSRLLAALEHLSLGPEQAASVSVVVVDNDESGATRGLVEQHAAHSRWPVAWFHEPRRGISFARNEVVRRAGDADFVAFIDDDEEPSPVWLDALLRVQAQYDADVVAGPVLSRHEVPPPEWVVRGRFFERPRYDTGAALVTGGTGNVLLRRSCLPDPPFCLELATTGGEDIYLFQELQLAGAKMVWCDEAVAYEWVPASRVKPRWLLMRAWRSGLARGYIQRRRPRRALDVIFTPLHGLMLLLAGIVFTAVLGPIGMHRLVRGLRRVCYGAGLMLGVFGLLHQEYREIHGS